MKHRAAAQPNPKGIHSPTNKANPNFPSPDTKHDTKHDTTKAPPPNLTPRLQSPPSGETKLQRLRPTPLMRSDSETSSGSVLPQPPSPGTTAVTLTHMLERILELEARLAASNIPTVHDETLMSPPNTIHQQHGYGTVHTPSLSVQRPMSGTGLTPPPSPKPEEVAKAMSDSPFTPSSSSSSSSASSSASSSSSSSTFQKPRKRFNRNSPKHKHKHNSKHKHNARANKSNTATNPRSTNPHNDPTAASLSSSSSLPALTFLSFLDYAQHPFRDGPMPSSSQNNNDNNEGAERLRMLRLVRVPYYVECTVNYGFAVALDSFLFYITILPLRALYAFVLVLVSIVSSKARTLVHGRHWHDIVQIGIFVTCTVLLSQVEMSRAYHTLRAQSFLKLYVIFNLFDILDKLLCALGQGIFDSLRWTLEHNDAATKNNNKDITILQYVTHMFSCFPFILAAVLYTFLHSLLSFSRMVALNVRR